jgi:hypothetical protein
LPCDNVGTGEDDEHILADAVQWRKERRTVNNNTRRGIFKPVVNNGFRWVQHPSVLSGMAARASSASFAGVDGMGRRASDSAQQSDKTPPLARHAAVRHVTFVSGWISQDLILCRYPESGAYCGDITHACWRNGSAGGGSNVVA